MPHSYITHDKNIWNNGYHMARLISIRAMPWVVWVRHRYHADYNPGEVSLFHKISSILLNGIANLLIGRIIMHSSSFRVYANVNNSNQHISNATFIYCSWQEWNNKYHMARLISIRAMPWVVWVRHCYHADYNPERSFFSQNLLILLNGIANLLAGRIIMYSFSLVCINVTISHQHTSNATLISCS